MTHDKYRELSVIFEHAASNVLVNLATGEAWLTGFGMASRLPASANRATPPSSFAGTFPCSGITLHKMLTGGLPFVASDPMEGVHCHSARQPASPGERSKNIAGPVSANIMKLVAKTAEERYQTAAGAESDLRRCLAEWETRRRIDAFPLGEHDTPELLILDKLYGRAREIETLFASFDRIVDGGSPELMLVSGYSVLANPPWRIEAENVDMFKELLDRKKVDRDKVRIGTEHQA